MKFLTPIILIAITFGLFFWYLNPTYTKIKTAKASLQEYNDAIEKTKAASARKDQLVAQYHSFNDADLDRLQKLLPDNINNIRFLVDVNAIASKYSDGITGIRLTTADESGSATTPGTRTAPYGTLSLSFNVKMGYTDFQKFLKDLEDSLKILDITNIAFSNSDTETSYNITLKTYWLR